jgi:hypothetical protein
MGEPLCRSADYAYCIVHVNAQCIALSTTLIAMRNAQEYPALAAFLGGLFAVSAALLTVGYLLDSGISLGGVAGVWALSALTFIAGYVFPP